MKRVILSLAILLGSVLGAYAQDAKAFLTKFKTFVEKVETVQADEISKDSLQHLRNEYKLLKASYSATYKVKMNYEQVEEYNRYRARYEKKIIALKTKRKGAAISGWVNGMLNND